MFHRVKPSDSAQEKSQDSDQFQGQSNNRDAEPETPKSRSTTSQKSTASASQKETTMSESATQKNQDTAETTAASSSPSSYQRGTQSPPGMRASAYSSTPYAPPAAAPMGPASRSRTEPEMTDNDRRLTIGRGITMSGEIEACDYLVVEGTVEAALKGANVLHVAESGTFYGTVEIEEATIAGRFEGELTVTGRLTIRSGGTITGSIAYGELEVEAGAVIDGRLTPVAGSEAGNAVRSGKGRSGGETTKGKQQLKQQGTPANSEGELFGAKAAAAE